MATTKKKVAKKSPTKPRSKKASARKKAPTKRRPIATPSLDKAEENLHESHIEQLALHAYVLLAMGHAFQWPPSENECDGECGCNCPDYDWLNVFFAGAALLGCENGKWGLRSPVLGDYPGPLPMLPCQAPPVSWGPHLVLRSGEEREIKREGSLTSLGLSSTFINYHGARVCHFFTLNEIIHDGIGDGSLGLEGTPSRYRVALTEASRDVLLAHAYLFAEEYDEPMFLDYFGHWGEPHKQVLAEVDEMLRRHDVERGALVARLGSTEATATMLDELTTSGGGGIR